MFQFDVTKLMTQLTGYVLIGGALYAFGLYQGRTGCAADVNAKTAEVQTKIIERHFIETKELKVRDLAREQALQARIDELRGQNGDLKDVLNAKPDPDPTVFMRLGDLRLLDSAAGGHRAELGSDPATIAAYQEQTPSDVSLRKFVGGEVDVRTQYNELATRCDALVQWNLDELVNRKQVTNPPKRSWLDKLRGR